MVVVEEPVRPVAQRWSFLAAILGSGHVRYGAYVLPNPPELGTKVFEIFFSLKSYSGGPEYR